MGVGVGMGVGPLVYNLSKTPHKEAPNSVISDKTNQTGQGFFICWILHILVENKNKNVED